MRKRRWSLTRASWRLGKLTMSLSSCPLLTISDSNPTLCGSRPKRNTSIPSIRRKLPTLVVAKVGSTPIDQSILRCLSEQLVDVFLQQLLLTPRRQVGILLPLGIGLRE